MKKLYFLLVFLGTMVVVAKAQVKPFRGSWYASSEIGIVSGRTRMVTGELSIFAPGGSGILVPYGFKIGYNFNPYLSLESGVGVYPVSMVYIFEDSKIIGSSPLRFLSIPLRVNWRIYVLNRQLEAYTSFGVQYIRANDGLNSNSFSGNIISSRHAFTDTLAYRGAVNVLRTNAFVADVGVGINWIMSKRFTLNVYGRQNIGLMNLAMVGISIQQNQEPAKKAEFVSRGTGLNVGVGLKYNFR